MPSRWDVAPGIAATGAREFPLSIGADPEFAGRGKARSQPLDRRRNEVIGAVVVQKALVEMLFAEIGDGAADTALEHRKHHAQLDLDVDLMRMHHQLAAGA